MKAGDGGTRKGDALRVTPYPATIKFKDEKIRHVVESVLDFNPKEIQTIVASEGECSPSREQRALNSAETPDEVLDAIEALIPNEPDKKMTAYHKRRHAQFVEQLQMIHSSPDTQIEAVCHYLTSSSMRLRWTAKKLKKEWLDSFRSNLFSIYRRHFDENRMGVEPPEIRGQHTFNKTVEEANKTDSIRIRGTERAVEFPFGTIEGEYHHMANGEDGVKVGWHPDWEQKIASGEIND